MSEVSQIRIFPHFVKVEDRFNQNKCFSEQIDVEDLNIIYYIQLCVVCRWILLQVMMSVLFIYRLLMLSTIIEKVQYNLESFHRNFHTYIFITSTSQSFLVQIFERCTNVGGYRERSMLFILQFFGWFEGVTVTLQSICN